jgi:uncharacterized protein
LNANKMEEQIAKEKGMSAEFVLRKYNDGTFGFVFQTEHGQVLLTSRYYCDQDLALRRLHSARQMARKDRNYELRAADEGGFYFVIRNREKEVLAFSQLYPDPESRQQGMILTRGCSHGARVENPLKDCVRKRFEPRSVSSPSPARAQEISQA